MPIAARNVLKPDVSAPGVDILAAFRTDGTGGPDFEIISGTSMASPHDAGAATLVSQVRPNWTPAQVQSALMSTAIYQGQRKEDGVTQTNPFDDGSGRIDISRAVNAGLLLNETNANFTAANPATGGNPRTLNIASMQNDACLVNCSWTRTFSNTLNTAVTWTLSVTSTAGLTLTMTPSSFTIPARGTQTVTFNANVTGLPTTNFVFGRYILTPNTTAAAPASFPVAVKATTGSVPTTVDITTRRNTGSQQSADITAIEITSLTVRKYGLTRGTPDAPVLPVDPTVNNVYDNLTTAGGIFLEDGRGASRHQAACDRSSIIAVARPRYVCPPRRE